MIVQQKHHTGRNATFKDHANGIKKAPNHKFKSMKGVSMGRMYCGAQRCSIPPLRVLLVGFDPKSPRHEHFENFGHDGL